MRAMLLAVTMLALSACSSDQATNPLGAQPDTPEQGVAGLVTFHEGDFMPVTEPQLPNGSITPVERMVYIFEPTTMNDVVVDGDGGFYSAVSTNLVKTVQSNEAGEFTVELGAGTYSLFVLEDGRFYANLWSSDYIQPVAVQPHQVTEFEIKITYKATY